MGRELQLSDLADFLALPRVAVLATYRRDGAVLLSPVWHTWRDGGFDVLTEVNDIKVRHLRRNAQASIVVYDDEPPYRGVVRHPGWRSDHVKLPERTGEGDASILAPAEVEVL